MHPRVGIGALLVSPAGRVLVGVRRSVAGAGTWALPGGHLELGESLAAAAARETEEETGLAVGGWAAVAVENCVVDADGRRVWGGAAVGAPPPPPTTVASHYVTVFMRASLPDEPVAANREPHKCEGWVWEHWRALGDGRPLFGPLAALVARCDDVRELKGDM